MAASWVDVEDLYSKVRILQTELEKVRDGVDRLENHDDVAGALSKQDNDLAGLTRRVKHLEQYLRVGSSRARATTGRQPEFFDFGEHKPELVKLVAPRERALDVSEALLAEYERTSLKNTINQFERLCTERQQHRDKALAASMVLATVPWNSTEHTTAAEDYRRAKQEYDSITRRHTAMTESVNTAQHKLRNDQAQRHKMTDVLVAGKTAEQTLNKRLRDRVVTMVTQAAEPPGWFSRVLGISPPPENPHGWVNLARDMLVYRCTYGIHDEIDALGPPPDSSSSRRRQRQHNYLRDQLRKYHC